MKRFMIILVLTFVTFSLLKAKPYEPQVKGPFKTCTVYENRTTSGKFNPKSRVISYIQTFDNNGNTIEMISYSNGKKEGKSKVENKYNDKGLLISTKYFDPTEKYFSLNTYGYDDKNNLIADTNFSMQNEITRKSVYIYDENNFLIQTIYEFKVENDWIKSPNYFKNDKFGNVIEESSKHSSETTFEVSIEADLSTGGTQSNVSQIESEADLEKVTYQYKYDEKNRVIWSLRNGIGGTKLIYSFKYDNYGNVIEEISYDENDIKKPLLKREYEYK